MEKISLRLIPKSIFFAMLLISTTRICISQQITGFVIDSSTNQPLPYAHIVKKSKHKGTISNQDGIFTLQYTEADTLIISYLSFKRKELPASYFLKESKCYLEPYENELGTVEALSNLDFLIDILLESKKKLEKVDPYKSKAYFALESTTNNTPIELLECYYNSEVRPTGFGDLQLKNGRIGLSPVDSTNFVSLNTTDVVSGYDILENLENKLPDNPLHFNKKKILSNYNYSILEFKNGIYEIGFLPKESKLDLFSANISLDRNKSQIVQVKLFVKNLKKRPLDPVSEEHQLSDFNINISYTFDDSEESTFQKITVHYDYQYDIKLNKYRIETNGVFLFYDKEELFDLPYYSRPDYLVNDYDKIVCQPYNEAFWENNRLLLPSKKSLEFRRFFKEKGVLLNFDGLEDLNSLFKNKITFWSKKRIFIYDLNGNFDPNVNAREDENNNPILKSDFYNLSAQIFLDRNEIKDSIHYLTQTIINSEDSFYYLEKNTNTICFINLYFDQVEIAKRKMLNIFNEKKWTKYQVDSIFKSTQINLDKDLKKYLKKVDHGNNEGVLSAYINSTKKALGINNAAFIERKEIEVTINDIFLKDVDKMSNKALYNYATALMKLEKYEEAIVVYKEGINRGYEFSWLYYNIGRAYLYLGNEEVACNYFKKIIEMGETVETELLENCE